MSMSTNTKENYSGVRFIHCAPSRISFGYKVEPAYLGDDLGTGLKVTAAVAQASPLDNFCRRIARNVLVGRITSMKPAVKHRHEFKVQGELPKTGAEWQEFERYLVVNIMHERGDALPFDVRSRYIHDYIPASPPTPISSLLSDDILGFSNGAEE